MYRNETHIRETDLPSPVKKTPDWVYGGGETSKGVGESVLPNEGGDMRASQNR